MGFSPHLSRLKIHSASFVWQDSLERSSFSFPFRDFLSYFKSVDKISPRLMDGDGLLNSYYFPSPFRVSQLLLESNKHQSASNG